MKPWQKQLKFDSIPALLEKNGPAIEYFTRRDLLEERVNRIQDIWELPVVQRILKRQQANGSWKSPSKNRKKHPAVNFDLTETWKQFRFLIDQYEMNNTNSSVERAAEFIFSCQTKEGDIRGILGTQYAAYYTGVILSLLIKCGYGTDPRVEKGLQWLLSVRQNDGGWLSGALMATDYSWKEVTRLTSQKVKTVKYTPELLSKPSSHNWTGMVIRAFVAHPKYRESTEIRHAANLLKARFFQKDPHYTSYQDADYWVRFQYPYWWNHLVAALDSLSMIGFSHEDKDIKNALNWLKEHQQPNGLWKSSYSKKHIERESKASKEVQKWISLAICRIFKRFNDF